MDGEQAHYPHVAHIHGVSDGQHPFLIRQSDASHRVVELEGRMDAQAVTLEDRAAKVAALEKKVAAQAAALDARAASIAELEAKARTVATLEAQVMAAQTISRGSTWPAITPFSFLLAGGCARSARGVGCVERMALSVGDQRS